ncbi:MULTISPECIES: F0F1 ATP synthase subunit B [unclassified Nocardia]|uniref:F0F1 ATP synthase subunit B family protein n=1 Tax=unclassified Nocardia TaxID=2637762 RepID=UPI001CE40AA0|nr:MULTISPECIES: F0F1 ATP synthase subunit B [unclassified Nocardia]
MATNNLAGQNFLIPNGTILVELLLFLIVLAVIWLFVVPPIREVLADRAARVAETAADRLRAAESAAAAQDRYRSELADARVTAAEIGRRARLDGQAAVAAARQAAQAEADEMVARTVVELRSRAARSEEELHAVVEPLARRLADRVVADR